LEIDPERFRIDPERFRAEPAPPKTKRAKRERLSRIEEDFAPVLSRRLRDRHYDSAYPPRTRLYLFIMIRSKRGAEPFALTQAEISGLNINRRLKTKYLLQLERAGLVSAVWKGRSAPIVAAAE
jgi:hypothetical protein